MDVVLPNVENMAVSGCYHLLQMAVSVRVKAFNDRCDRIFSLFTCGVFGVTVANKQFNSLNGDYELVVLEETQFNVCHDTPIVTVHPLFTFRSIVELEKLPVNRLYDCKGVIRSIASLSSVREQKTGRSLPILRLLVGDGMGNISVCLWNELASNFVGAKNNEIALKNFRLHTYRDMRSLNSVMGSEVFLNPSTEEKDLTEVVDNCGGSSLDESLDE